MSTKFSLLDLKEHMKINKITTNAILILLLFFTPKISAQTEDYTEKDWINYAKAQGSSYDFTLSSLNNIMRDKEYEDYLDSMARTDVFSPLFYKGVELRKSEIKPPVLTGTVSYYFLTGKLASQMDFVNGVANGKCIYYYPNGNIYKKEAYRNGVTYERDTIKTFSTKGQLIHSIFETDSAYFERTYSYEGKLLGEIIDYKAASLEFTNSQKYFDIETKTEEKIVFTDTKTVENFYDYNGKKVNEEKANILLMKEIKNHPFEKYAAFPKSKTEIVEQTENELLSSHYRKVKNRRMKMFIQGEIGESFKPCANYEVLKELNYNNYAFSNNSNYPHSTFLDTLFCEPGKQVLRTAQTKSGKLHGELKYFYTSGQILALLNFNEDYPDGDFKFYYTNGNIKKRSKYKMAVAIDSTFEFTNNNLLKTLTVWEDSVKYVKTSYWENGKTIQQIELCTGENLAVKKQYGSMRVAIKKIMENRYYNKQGEEITKKQFSKDYPKILRQPFPFQTRAQF